MVQRRVWIGALCIGVCFLAIFLVRYFWSSSVSADYTAGNFTVGASGTTYAYDSTSNVFVGSFVLPTPVSDVLIHDGISGAVGTKNTLRGFASSDKFYDQNNDGVYDNGEGMISSVNGTLEATDTVTTTVSGALTTFSTVEAVGTYYVYFDQGGTANSFDTGEDVYRQVFNSAACSSADGVGTIRIPEATLAFIDVNNDNSIDFEVGGETYGLNGDTIFRDADSDSKPSSGDSVIVAQGSGVTAFSAGDLICFDGSIVNDSEYDFGEVLWKDVAGDCASFTSTTDTILVGVGAPAGTSTLASTDSELGYLDTNAGGTFTCPRTGACEPPVYSGADATPLITGSFIIATAVFFDSSTEGTDGIATLGTGWDESGGAEYVKSWTELDGFDTQYVYNDCDSSAAYNVDEDIYKLAMYGSTSAMVSGVTLRTFDASEKVLMTPGTAISELSSGSGSIIYSVNSDLDIGVLNGGGTDSLFAGATTIFNAPINSKYYDSNGDTLYEDGEDIVLDVDGSGYYGADSLQSLKVTTALGGDAITDSYLTGVYIYERSGSTCIGSGTDTLIGSDTSAPFLDQTISITKGVYAASDSISVRTVCVFANIADNSVHGKIWTLEIPQNGAVFASSSLSPVTTFTAVSAPVQFVAPLAATIYSTSSKPSVTASYTFTYTLTDDGISNAFGLFSGTFPSGYSVVSASVSCTDDGVSVAVTPSVVSQTVLAVNASGSAVASGSVVSCTVTNVVNPVTVGTSNPFTISAYTTSTSRALYVDADNTVTLSSGNSSGGASSAVESVTILEPNGGESYAAQESVPVTWSTTGSSIAYITLAYSIDSGATWTVFAVNENNDGVYSWVLPNISSDSVLLKIEGSDGLSLVSEDVSDEVFAITGGTGLATIEDLFEEQPLQTISTLAAGIFIKTANDPTVYYVDSYFIRHPLFDAQAYFTYRESFDAVYQVELDVLNQSVLGQPQPVNAGTVLIKYGSLPTVYTVNQGIGESFVLRQIPDEATAIAALGSDWEMHLIELFDSSFPYYQFDPTFETVESLQLWATSPLFTDRWHLMYENSSVDADGDGAATWLEASWGTSPYNPDTDGDGYNDKIEVDTGHSPFFGEGV